jgi:hypothetical protein
LSCMGILVSQKRLLLDCLSIINVIVDCKLRMWSGGKQVDHYSGIACIAFC